MTEQICGNCVNWLHGECLVVSAGIRACGCTYGCEQFELNVAKQACGNCKWWRSVDGNLGKCRAILTPLSRLCRHDFSCNQFEAESVDVTERVCGDCKLWHTVDCAKQVKIRQRDKWITLRPAENAGGCSQFDAQLVSAGPFKAWEVQPTTGISFEPQSILLGNTNSVYSVSIHSVVSYAGMQRLAKWLNEKWYSIDAESGPQSVHPSYTNQFTAVRALDADWGIQFHNHFFYSKRFDEERVTALVKWLNRLCQKYPFGCFRTEVQYLYNISPAVPTGWGIKFCHHVMKQTMPYYAESFKPHLSEKSVTGLVEWLNKQWKQLGEQQHVPDGKSDKPFVPERTSRGTWHVAAHFLDSSGWVAKKLRESEARRVAVWLNERWRTPGSRLSRPFVPIHILSTKSWSVRGCFATDSGWLAKDLCEYEACRITEWLNEQWQTDR